MSSFTVLYDANVLYPAPLRDLLIQLPLTDLYRAKWTAEIHEEWITAVLRERQDLKREQLERTRRLMDEHVRDALVTGYEDLIPTLNLPDPKDRHVLAAAIVGRADHIITSNLKHFPATALEPFGIEAQHPDEFLRHLIDLNTPVVCEAVKKVRARLRNPPVTPEKYFEILERMRLPLFVGYLRGYAALI